MACVLRARDTLATLLARVPAVNAFRDEPGVFLGGGRMTRKDAETGVEAYGELLELYALRAAHKSGVAPSRMDPAALDYDPADTGLADDDAAEHAHAMAVLARVGGLEGWEARLRAAEARWAAKVAASKARDAERGAVVFPPGHYAAADAALDGDAVVKRARARM